MIIEREGTQQNTTPQRAPVWEKAFLSVLRKAGNVTRACAKAKIERSTAYDHRNSDKRFAQLWEHALEESADILEAEARRRAFEGVTKPVYQGGIRVGYVQEYSDSLMALLLKANNPKKFRENIDVTSGGEKIIPIAVTKMDLDEL